MPGECETSVSGLQARHRVLSPWPPHSPRRDRAAAVTAVAAAAARATATRHHRHQVRPARPRAEEPRRHVSGFDVDVATYVAERARLRTRQDRVEGIAVGAAREPDRERPGRLYRRHLLDHRRAQGEGRLRGPLPVTGQSLLVQARQHRHHRRARWRTTRSCARCRARRRLRRSRTSIPTVQLQQYDTYSACVEALKNGAVDAVTTDEVILAGYAAQSPGAFKIVGEPFSEENYGIGLKKDDTELLHQDQRCAEEDGGRRRLEGGVREEPRPGGYRDAGASAHRRTNGPPRPPRERVGDFHRVSDEFFAAFWVDVQLTVFSATGAL